MRHTSNLCQSCFYEARREQYFPDTDRWGDCCACGDQGFIARVRKAEAQRVAASLYGDPLDRPACCQPKEA